MANNQRRQPQDNGIRKVPASSKDIFRLARIESEKASQKPVVRRQPILEPRVHSENTQSSNTSRNSSRNTQSAASKRTYGSKALPPQRTSQVVRRTEKSTPRKDPSYEDRNYNSSNELTHHNEISQSLKDTVKKATVDSQNRKNEENNKKDHFYKNETRSSTNPGSGVSSNEENAVENSSYDVNHVESKKKKRGGFLGFFSKDKSKNEAKNHIDSQNVSSHKEHVENQQGDHHDNQDVKTTSITSKEYDSSEPIDFSQEVEYQYIETGEGLENDHANDSGSNKKDNLRKPVSISPSSDTEQEYENSTVQDDEEEQDLTIIETSDPLSPEQINALSSSSVKIVPKNIEKKKRTIGAFPLVMTNWFVGIFTAAVALAGFGYYIYLDAAHEKDTTAAYDQGVRDATSEDTINSVMKKDPQQVKEMIVEAARGSFPKDVSTTDIIMDGWTVPRGKQNYGRVDVSVCFTGEGIEGNKVAKAHFISDNANSTDPQWMVDAVAITQEDCWK